ncbi:MAG: sulfotransferase domain-containing protein [Acidimicrobiales bacterium]
MTQPQHANYPEMTPYGAKYEPPAGLVASARVAALRGFRLVGRLTARRRVKPEYLIIGTKRGGTTSLARWLLEHPDVGSLWPSRETRKGTYYFDVNYGKGQAWYLSHFPTEFGHRLAEKRAGRHITIGEATPYYLHHPHAAVRARRLLPDVKVIALVRNPMERAYSHWVERTRNGVETLSFAEAVKAESDRLAGEEQHMLDDPSYVSFAHQHYSYVDQGRYARGLRRWLEAYPPEQVLILRSEDLYADPDKTYGQVLDFLDLRDHVPASFAAWNKKPKEPIDDSVMAELRELLKDDIAELESLLNRPMGWL